MGAHSIVVILLAICSIICWILVLVKIFQEGSVGLGILGILCGLFAFIYRWIKVNEYGIRNIMLVWTACIVLNLILQVAFGAMMHAH